MYIKKPTIKPAQLLIYHPDVGFYLNNKVEIHTDTQEVNLGDVCLKPGINLKICVRTKTGFKVNARVKVAYENSVDFR